MKNNNSDFTQDNPPLKTKIELSLQLSVLSCHPIENAAASAASDLKTDLPHCSLYRVTKPEATHKLTHSRASEPILLLSPHVASASMRVQ